MPPSARPHRSHATADDANIALKSAGVDGCRGGWIVATRSGARVVRRLGSTITGLDHIGIDMPIGLPSAPGRAADRAARAFLGARRSSVFPAPPRPIVHHTTHAAANASCRAMFGSGLSVQAFNLFDKIREVDLIVRALPPDERAQRIVEVHPECSFRAMTGRELAPKRSAEGADQRRTALLEVFGSLPGIPRGAAEDDLLDAFAVLWTVERFIAGTHMSLPPTESVELDEAGIPMRIIV